MALATSLAVAFSGPAPAADAAASELRPGSRIESRTIGARPAAAPAPATYVVRLGDTVSGIAARFGLRTADVLALNGLGWRSIIRPGQVLKLRAKAKPAARPKPAKPARPTTKSYMVRVGDTVTAIAKRHGVSVQAVLAANRLDWSSIIYPGQKLVVPGAAQASATIPKPRAGASSPAPAARTYVIKAGDTVTAIAKRHGVSVQAVLTANRLVRSSIIYPGQKLTIPAKATATGLDAEQTANAKLIISVGRSLGVPERGIAIALGTAMQESWLRNLDWGDRDSLGLFQQRPSTGWGTAAEVRDAKRSARAFFGGPKDPNGTRTRGLLDIDGWQRMSFAEAAQAVQISAYPDRYAKWEKPAYAWLAALG